MRPSQLRVTGLLIVTVLASACTLIPGKHSPSRPAETISVARPEASPAESVAPRGTAPADPVMSRAAQHTAVVVSDDIPAYQQIVAEIRRRGTALELKLLEVQVNTEVATRLGLLVPDAVADSR